MQKYIIILFTFLSMLSCNTKNDVKKPSTVFVFKDQRDTATFRYYEFIMNLPEFQSWEYNHNNINRDKVIGFAEFEQRKLIIDSAIFYHIELSQQKMARPEESRLHQKEIVCYFRVDAANKTLRILNTETNEFLMFNTDAGRRYFQSCLARKSE